LALFKQKEKLFGCIKSVFVPERAVPEQFKQIYSKSINSVN